MAPRAKGKAAAKVKNTLSTANADKPSVAFPTAVITVPQDESPTSETTTATRDTAKPKKNKKENATVDTDAGDDKKLRGKAAFNTYLEDLVKLAPGTSVETWKKTLGQVRDIATAQLKTKGCFKIPGVCELCVRQRKGREAKLGLLFGKEITMKAKPPSKRVYAKVPKEFSDQIVNKINS